VTINNAQVEGQFNDGSPAVTMKANGKGRAVYCAFLPGLTYFKPALPKRPVDRSSRDESLCHLVPTKFDMQASVLIGSIAGLDRAIVCSNPLVETSVIESSHGAAILLNNWSGEPAKNLQLKLNIVLRFSKATLASGKRLHLSRNDQRPVFTFNLNVADALILR
jgi:hypothetical protein